MVQTIKTITQQPDYKVQLLAILQSKRAPKAMQEVLSNYHENDIAATLQLLKKEERLRLYDLLDIRIVSKILAYTDEMQTYMDELDLRKQAAVLSQMEPSTAAAYLRSRSKQECALLVDCLEPGVREEIGLRASFQEDQIGSQMTVNYIKIQAGSCVRDAMRQLVQQAAVHDNVSTIYVIGRDRTFIGAIALKDLIIAREDTPLAAITMTAYPYVYANESIEEGIPRLCEYAEDSIPVLNQAHKLCGVLTARDLTRLTDEVMGEDYARLAGLTAEEDLEESLWKSIRKRLPWLVILLGLGLVVSSVVGLFEQVVASLTLIVCFQSLILDMAGNVGTQSLAVTIRVLMDEQLTGKKKLQLILTEGKIGLCNGAILGGLSFLLIGGYLFLVKGEALTLAFSVSFCTGIALLVSMLLSSLTGTVVPLVFQKFKIDPAVASGPLITTMNDLVAVVTYYGMAWLLLIRVLQV